MKKFLKRYLMILKGFPKNPWFYLWIGLILLGGHTPKGKVIAIFVSTFIILPLFAMLGIRTRKLQEKQ